MFYLQVSSPYSRNKIYTFKLFFSYSYPHADIIYDVYRDAIGTMDRLRQGVHLSTSDVAGFVKRVFDKTTRVLKLTS